MQLPQAGSLPEEGSNRSTKKLLAVYDEGYTYRCPPRPARQGVAGIEHLSVRHHSDTIESLAVKGFHQRA